MADRITDKQLNQLCRVPDDDKREYADGYDTDQALADLRRIARALAADTENANAQGDAADIEAAADWFATGQFE